VLELRNPSTSTAEKKHKKLTVTFDSYSEYKIEFI